MILDPIRFIGRRCSCGGAARVCHDCATSPPAVSLRLADARLCPDCDLLFSGPTCPGCAGRSWWPLALHLCQPPTRIVRSKRRRKGAA